MRIRMLLLLTAIGTPAIAADSGLGGLDCIDLRGLPKNFDVTWQEDIKPLFNELYPTGRCTSCHNSGQRDGGLDLSDEEGIDAIYKLVPTYAIPGDPRMSILIDKLACADPGWGGRQMPYGQSPFGVAELGLIYDWIAQGAPGDVKGEQPIPRDFIFRDGAESLRF